MLVERLKVALPFKRLNRIAHHLFCVLQEADTSLYRPALETLRTLIRTSTSSMTSVPKPLKFLRPHYPDLQALFDTWPSSADKVLLFASQGAGSLIVT